MQVHLWPLSLDPTGVVGTRWTMRWKRALSTFAITLTDRRPRASTHRGWERRATPFAVQALATVNRWLSVGPVVVPCFRYGGTDGD
jgi:hypothetical protein